MHGIRPVNIRHDLDAIADLIELCFADRMDSTGRAAVNDIRALARLGIGLWFLQSLDRMLKGLMQGFVWEADGAIVGNVSIYPAGYDHTWVIANVAVHPDFRGQHIANKLCQTAMERVLGWRGKRVILQVDHDNETAKHLYYRLGFHMDRAFTRWYWSASNPTPRPLTEMPYITYRKWRDWQQEYALAEQLRPNEQGGMGWLRPTQPDAFRMSLGKILLRFFSTTAYEHFVVRGDDGLDAVLLTESNFGSSAIRFDLLIAPDHQTSLAHPMVNYLLRHAALNNRGAYTDHPAEDIQMAAVFTKHQFVQRRTLIHMRWEAE